MKKNLSIILCVIMVTTFNSCDKEKHEQTDQHKHIDSNGVSVVKTKIDITKKTTAVHEKISASIKDILTHYLEIKNALVVDNGKNASIAGKAMVVTISNLDKSLLTDEQKKIYADIEDDAKEHAEHIGENASKIDHQREHFVIMSNDIYDLVKAFGGGQPLYKFFCPMANDGKGALWLSDTKEVKNPYYGSKMLKCGAVKEDIK